MAKKKTNVEPGKQGFQRTVASAATPPVDRSKDPYPTPGTLFYPSPEPRKQSEIVDEMYKGYEKLRDIHAEEPLLPLDYPEPTSKPAREKDEDTHEEPDEPLTILDNLKAGQLPLTLTAAEIRDVYQAIDGDRDGEWESDDALYSRKLAETAYRDQDGETVDYDDIDEDDYYTDDDGNPIEPDRWTLANDLEMNDVIYPISLQEDPSKKGSKGKPEVLGGHHRIAWMAEHKPSIFMPVEFYPDQETARRKLGWRY